MCSCIAPPLLQMKVQPFPPSKTRSFALSSEGCQNSSSGESSEPFCALRVSSTAHGYLSSYRFDRGLVSLQALGDEGHRHRHGLHIFRSLQCASFLANTRNVLHHALLHHNEEADQGKCSHMTRQPVYSRSDQTLFKRVWGNFRKAHNALFFFFLLLFPAHDQVQILTLHTRKEDIQRQGRNRETLC